ncbi:sodium/proline symporter [Halalkalibacterium halodurans]|uniref:sodium/proline symporter n=1 Tax=Halalkalibacterium halodurans TaxID=86665 RepID=UPI002AA98D31|nr:sodium/proline symporter [Halalkalibacterium halodurans]MDY7223237.1 sodium/proline symporter [Halalkalibacterium halodurans]MDY7242458.1 sodium/proline symporter [Halalkalibacterium halodurans]
MVEPLAVAILIAYLVALLLIGLLSSKKSSVGMTDFFLAGRNLNKWTVALSAVSSGRSAWLVLGVTGTAYATGLDAVWAVAGYIAVEVFLFFYVARRFRAYSEQTGSITIPDILETRFNDKTHILRGVSAFITMFFMIAYVASQLVAGGGAFATSMGVSSSTGMWVTAVILLAYTMLGGFHAVSKTDVVQAGFMFVSLVILPVVAIIGLGGFDPLLQVMHTEGGGFTSPFAFGFGAVIGLLGIGFGSPGNPHILVRYMSLKNVKEMRQAALISSVWNVLMGWGAVMIGLAGRAYFPDISLLPNGDQEQVFLTLGSEILHPLFFGFLLVAVLAAIMSSADSQLLVGSSAFVRDIYQKMFRRNRKLSQKKLVRLSRLTTVVFMGLSLILAFTAQEFVFWMVLFAFGGLGACFGPALLLSFYWKGVTRQGVLWGMIAGLLTVILVKQQPQWTYAFLPDVKELLNTYFFGITYEAVPGFIVATTITVVISLFTKRPKHAKQIIERLNESA